VYSSYGPYLTSVTIATDDQVVVVKEAVALEIHVIRETAINVTKGTYSFDFAIFEIAVKF